MANKTITPDQYRKLKVSHGSLVEKANKHNVSSVERRTFDGIVFHSELEAKYAAILKKLADVGDVIAVARQIPFALHATNGVYLCKYVADFVVAYRSGHIEVIEVTGQMTAMKRLKLKWMKAEHHIDVIILREKDIKILP